MAIMTVWMLIRRDQMASEHFNHWPRPICGRSSWSGVGYADVRERFSCYMHDCCTELVCQHLHLNPRAGAKCHFPLPIVASSSSSKGTTTTIKSSLRPTLASQFHSPHHPHHTISSRPRLNRFHIHRSSNPVPRHGIVLFARWTSRCGCGAAATQPQAAPHR